MTPKPSTAKGEEAAAAILNAAHTCFLSKGYNGTSMRDIAKAAGYKSVAGIYNHYSDKERVFVAVLHDRHPYEELAAQVEAIKGHTAAELLPKVITVLSDFIHENGDFFRLVLIDYLEFDARHARSLIEAMQGRLISLVDRLSTAPDMPDFPPALILRSVAIQIMGFVLTDAIMPDEWRGALDREGWQAHLGQLLLHGLFSSSTHHED